MLRALTISSVCVVVTLATTSNDDFVPFADLFTTNKRSAVTHDDRRLELTVNRHDTCTFRSDQAFEPIIEFDNTSLVRENPLVGEGCYSVSGKVHVTQDLYNPLHIYVETRILPLHRRRPMECYGADNTTGCGGFGSCVYCDSCRLQRQIHGARLTRNGEQLACGVENDKEGVILERGTHDDVTLSFCMPTKGEFKSALNLTEESWQSVIQSEAPNGEVVSERRMFMVMYVFNKDLSTLARKQGFIINRRRNYRDAQILAKWRADNTQLEANGLERLPRPETGYPLELSDGAFNSLPINREVYTAKSFVGCHKISGIIHFDDKNTATSPPARPNGRQTPRNKGRRNNGRRG